MSGCHRGLVLVFFFVSLCQFGLAAPVKFCENNLAQLKNVCELQSSLKVVSNVAGEILNEDTCNTSYNKEDYASQPVQVSYSKALEDSSYTLAMIDPDAPNHPQGNYYLHWIVTNIRGSDLVAGKVDSGTVVASYRGPAPPKNTGDHRYLFLVFEQTKTQLNLTEPQRPQFNLSSWVQSAAHLCGPVAGVQFKAHF